METMSQNSDVESATQQRAAQNAQPSFAVVLGSSGTRAFAALPFLQHLDSEGLKPDLVIGSGGGGLIAALWCAGYDLDQIVEIFTRHFTRDAYESLSSEELNSLISERAGQGDNGSKGLYTPHALRKAYQTIFRDMQIQNLPHKTLLYATDVHSGEGVCLESGSIATAVEACGACSPVMPPVEREGVLLANGSIVSPLPVMEAVKRDMQLILAVHLEETAHFAPANFLESAMAVNRITARSLRRSQLFNAISLHKYEICVAEVHYPQPVLPWDVEHIPNILMQARMTAQDKIPELLELRKSIAADLKDQDFTYHTTKEKKEAHKGSTEGQEETRQQAADKKA